MNRLRNELNKKKKTNSAPTRSVSVDSSLNEDRKEKERDQLGRAISLCKSEEINDFGESKLHQHVIFCEFENVKKLMGVVDVNVTDFSGKTPLHHAAELGYWDICLLLLENNANIQKVDSAGFAAINTLRPKGSLMDNPTYKMDRRKETPLHTATGRGRDWLVKFLVLNGSNINSQTESGSTALHYALGTDNLTTAKVLLELKADYTLKDKNGYSFISSLDTKVGWFEVLKEFFDQKSNMQEIIEKSLKNSCEQEDLLSLVLSVNKIVCKNENECPALREAIPILEKIISIALSKSNETSHSNSNLLSLSDGSDIEIDDNSIISELVKDPLYNYKSVREFIISEERLLNFLEQSKSVYFDPISSAKYINDEDKHFVVSKFETVFNTISTFVRSLNDYKLDIAKNPDSKKFLEALSKMSSYLKLFKPYCREYDNVVQKINDIKKSAPKFQQLLDTGVQLSNQDIYSILIMPIQRVMRYPLLLEAILKEVPENHVEYQDLFDVYGDFKKYAEVIDRDKEIATRRLEVMKLLNKFDPNEKLELVQAHRYLVHEGDMKILISDEKAEKKRVFIFNDMLLVASYVESTNDEKKKGKGFIYKYQFSFPWIGSWVYLLPNCEGTLLINSLQVVHYDDIEQSHCSYTFIADTPKDLETWNSTIKKCISQSSGNQTAHSQDNLRFVTVEGYLDISRGDQAKERVFGQLKGSTIFLYQSKKSHIAKDKIVLNEYQNFAIETGKKKGITLTPKNPPLPQLTIHSDALGASWVKEISKHIG